jgi:hypothetical protein
MDSCSSAPEEGCPNGKRVSCIQNVSQMDDKRQKQSNAEPVDRECPSTSRGLYDCFGVLLVQVPTQNIVHAQVFAQKCMLKVKANAHTMTITRSFVGNTTRDEMCQKAVALSNAKIARSQAELDACQQCLDGNLCRLCKQDNSVETNVKLGATIVQLSNARNDLVRTLQRLRGDDGMQVEFFQSHTTESVQLALNTPTRVSFLDHPVMYRTGTLSPASVTSVVEIRPDRVSLSTWKAEQILGNYKTSYGNSLANVVVTAVVASDDNLFFSDAASSRVLVYDIGGHFVRTLGGDSELPDHRVKTPTSLAIEDHRIFVADSENFRVCIYNKHSGAYIGQIGGGRGLREGQLDGITVVSVSLGHVYVTETTNNRVSVFCVNGDFVRVIGTPELGVLGTRSLKKPTSVSVANGIVYVTDGSPFISVFHSDDGRLDHTLGPIKTPEGHVVVANTVVALGERLFIIDQTNKHVSICNRNGSFIKHFENTLNDQKIVDSPVGLSIGREGAYVINTTGKFGMVQVFT